jgi:hypothetical protein
MFFFQNYQKNCNAILYYRSEGWELYLKLEKINLILVHITSIYPPFYIKLTSKLLPFTKMACHTKHFKTETF